jgi:hypothetical protein
MTDKVITLNADQHKVIRYALEHSVGSGITFDEIKELTVADMLYAYRDAHFDALLGDAGPNTVGDVLALARDIFTVDSLIGERPDIAIISAFSFSEE